MKTAKSILRYALALAQTPAGMGAISALGGPLAGMIVKFGSVGITSAMDATEGDEISEEQIAAHLASKGLKVTPFDPATLWGVPS